MGTFFGLRGNIEHSEVQWSNIEHSSFPEGSEFSGLEYVGVTKGHI